MIRSRDVLSSEVPELFLALDGNGSITAEGDKHFNVYRESLSRYELSRAVWHCWVLPLATVAIGEDTVVVDAGQRFEYDRGVIEIALVRDEQKELPLE